jgi:hypothetical protein
VKQHNFNQIRGLMPQTLAPITAQKSFDIASITGYATCQGRLIKKILCQLSKDQQECRKKAGDTHSHGPLKGGPPTNQVVYNRLEFPAPAKSISKAPHTQRTSSPGHNRAWYVRNMSTYKKGPDHIYNRLEPSFAEKYARYPAQHAWNTGDKCEKWALTPPQPGQPA